MTGHENMQKLYISKVGLIIGPRGKFLSCPMIGVGAFADMITLRILRCGDYPRLSNYALQATARERQREV